MFAFNLASTNNKAHCAHVIIYCRLEETTYTITKQVKYISLLLLCREGFLALHAFNSWVGLVCTMT